MDDCVLKASTENTLEVPKKVYKIMVYDTTGKTYRLFATRFTVRNHELIIYENVNSVFHFMLEHLIGYSIKSLAPKETVVNSSEEI